MRHPFVTELTRTVASSLGRFLAILGIAGLGVGFFAGLNMVGSTMRGAADALYDGTALYDIRLVSTLGFSDAQVDAVRGVEGVGQASGEYACDAMCKISGDSYAIRVMSFDAAAAAASHASDDLTSVEGPDSYLNRLILAEGAWPVADDECVLSADKVMGTPVRPGDRVEVLYGTSDLDGVLDVRELKVTGLVHASSFVSSGSLGSTRLGGGTIQQFMYVPRGTFGDDLPFTEIYATVPAARQKRSGSEDYKACVNEVKGRVEALDLAGARYDEVVAKANDELDKGQREYDDKSREAADELDQARAELDAAEAKLDAGRAELEDARAQLSQGEAEYAGRAADAEAQLDEAEAQLDGARRIWLETRGDLEGQLEEVRGKLGSLTDQQTTLTQAVSDLTAAAAELQAGIDALPVGHDAERQQLEAQLAVVNAQLSQAGAGLDEVNGGIVACEEGIAELEEGIATGDARVEAAGAELAAARDEAASQMDAARSELDAAAAQIRSGEAELASGAATLANGRSEYDAASADAAERLADAASQLDAARDDISNIKRGDVYLLDRTKNPGAASFQSDSERIDNIARVFPLIFFMVAALVSLTTMTRMVEDERVNIGTHKALGFSRTFVTMRYLVYAALACVVGSAIGIAVLSQALPYTVMKAYAIVYSVPIPRMPMDINATIAAQSVGLGLVITLGATFGAASASLAESPAALMLPRAPRPGKRILLERIGPVWSRLSFSRKVTMRNLFRFKRRLLMTTVGIAGCCALLLTGLGLHDSINDIITYQFEGSNPILRYNTEVTFEPNASAQAWDDADATLERTGAATRSRVELSNMRVAPASGGNDEATVAVVPTSAEGLTSQVDLRERTTHQAVPFDGSSVVLTEKIAHKMGVGPGSKVRVFDQDDMGNATGEGYELTVTGVSENYVLHYIYVGPDAWHDATGSEVKASAILGRTDTSGETHDMVSSLMERDGVETVIFNTETIDTYRTSLKSVNMIVTVLVAAAAALAFIVLYNLTNINIVERTREIASLKVLGFLPGEVVSYIFREVANLVVMGAVAGLALGVVLEGFVVQSSEVDLVMFGRDIHPPSFAIAFALTLVFAAVVMVVMIPKLRKIDMVESLKSVD